MSLKLYIRLLFAFDYILKNTLVLQIYFGSIWQNLVKWSKTQPNSVKGSKTESKGAKKSLKKKRKLYVPLESNTNIKPDNFKNWHELEYVRVYILVEPQNISNI